MSRGFRGVRDDLSEFARRFLDAALFIVAVSTDSALNPDGEDGDEESSSKKPRQIAGAMSDLAELRGQLKSGIARISSVLSWKLVDKRDDRNHYSSDVGVRKEIVGFVRDLAKSAEYWTEFPVPVDDHFDMSTQQKEHIANVERQVPSLATLRITLCPQFMNGKTFWKIYFALLHPQLNEHESELLSTHQVVEEMRTNLRKRMESRVNSDPQNLVPGSSGDTKHEMEREEQEDNMQNRTSTMSQNPVAENSSSSTSENPKAENSSSTMSKNPEAEGSSSTMSKQAGELTEEEGETYAVSRTQPDTSLRDGYFYIEASDRDDTVSISSSVDPRGQGCDQDSHQKPVSLADHDASTQSPAMLLRHAESSEWQAVEGIWDFEIVEGS